MTDATLDVVLEEKPKTVEHYFQDKNMSAKLLANGSVYFNLYMDEPAEVRPHTPEEKKLDAFERYIRNCGKDGHKIEYQYWDQDKTKLKSKSVVDKKGISDGPCIFFDEDGKTKTTSWFRKGKLHGKLVKTDMDGHELISKFYKHGKTVGTSTLTTDGKVSKFFYQDGESITIMMGGKVPSYYKYVMKRRIAAAQERLQEKKEMLNAPVKQPEPAKKERPQTKPSLLKQIKNMFTRLK